MSNDVITISGLLEVQKNLYAYSQQLGDRVVRAALRQGANYVLKGIRQLVPVKTGLLKRRGFRVSNSRIHNGWASDDLIGVYISLRKGKDAPFYGRFQNDGWNAAGERRTSANTPGRWNRHGTKYLMSRSVSKNVLGHGRATLPSNTNIPGKGFVQRAFEERKEGAVKLIVQSATAGSEVVKRKLGLK
jgi:hypothetical protein